MSRSVRRDRVSTSSRPGVRAGEKSQGVPLQRQGDWVEQQRYGCSAGFQCLSSAFVSLSDQVLQQTAELLDRAGGSSVSDHEVAQRLQREAAARRPLWPHRSPPPPLAEVRRLMAQLVEEGALLGPRNATRGGLRDGAGRLLNVDVIGMTELGRTRLARATQPWWRRAWRWGGRPAAIAIWGLVALVIAGVAVFLLTGNMPRRGLLP